MCITHEEWEHHGKTCSERADRRVGAAMDIVLIAGLWLDGKAWHEVVPELEQYGHRVDTLTLPGQGDRDASATLEDQLTAIVKAIDKASGPVMVVGHSAACTLAWMSADARAENVAKVVLIGGFPSADGEPYADFFPTHDGLMAFPGWGPFEGPDVADLSEEQCRRIEVAAIPVPEGVTKAIVHLGDERRYAVPTLVVCPEFTADDARAWIEAGDVPELAQAAQLEFVDIDSGHWPMFSQPHKLAQVLDDATKQTRA